jgi:hypothetical protein
LPWSEIAVGTPASRVTRGFEQFEINVKRRETGDGNAPFTVADTACTWIGRAGGYIWGARMTTGGGEGTVEEESRGAARPADGGARVMAVLGTARTICQL